MTQPRSDGQPPIGLYMGIDPGLTGGIVVLDSYGSLVVREEMPVLAGVLHLPGVLQIILDLERKNPLVAIESQQAFPGRGVKALGSIMFQFGALQGICIARGIPVHLVRPKEWQKGIPCPAKATPKQRKEAWMAEAVRRWPELQPQGRNKKPHSGICDAAMIADWLRKTHNAKM